MRCSILLIAVIASSGLTAPTPEAGGPAQLSELLLSSVSTRGTALVVVSFLLTLPGPATKRAMGERGLHYADVSADDDAILYRWLPKNAQDGETIEEIDTDSVEVADEALS